MGLIVSSFIYTRFQPRLLFLIFAIGNGAAAIAYSLCFRLCKKHLQKPVRMTANANIPKIVIDSGKDHNEIVSRSLLTSCFFVESTVPEEPMLISPSTDSTDKRTIDQ